MLIALTPKTLQEAKSLRDLVENSQVPIPLSFRDRILLALLEKYESSETGLLRSNFHLMNESVL